LVTFISRISADCPGRQAHDYDFQSHGVLDRDHHEQLPKCLAPSSSFTSLG
jgi:hypothetical protein